MEIKVYSTTTCFWCQKVKDWLKKNRLGFQELNIVETDTYRDEMIEKSSQMAVPVVVIKDNSGKEEVVVGFDEERLKSLLAKEKPKEKAKEKPKGKKKRR